MKWQFIHLQINSPTLKTILILIGRLLIHILNKIATKGKQSTREKAHLLFMVYTVNILLHFSVNLYLKYSSVYIFPFFSYRIVDISKTKYINISF